MFNIQLRRIWHGPALSGLARLLRRPKSLSYVFTFFAQLCVLGANLLTYKLAAVAFGLDGFGAYVVARRVGAIVCFPVLLGLGIGVPRYVAEKNEARDGGEDRGDLYYVAAWVIAVPVLLAALALTLAFPGALTRLFFSRDDYDDLLLPTFTVVAGMYVYQIVYGYHVGRLQLWTANTLCLINLALVPPMALALSGGDVGRALAGLGLAMLGVSLAVSLRAARRLRPGPKPLRSCLGPLHQLLAFGLPRVPGEFALFGLSAIPSILVAHRNGIEQAGLISFCYSLIQMISSMFAVVGTLLLPIVGRMKRQGQADRISLLMAWIIAAVLTAVVIMVAVAEVSLGAALPLLLNQDFAGAVPEVRWALLAAIPYVLYIILRGPLDALEDWPHNTINLCLALGIIVLLLVAGPGSVSPSAALLIGLLALGLTSLASWVRSLRRFRWRSRETDSGEPDRDGSPFGKPQPFFSGAAEMSD